MSDPYLQDGQGEPGFDWNEFLRNFYYRAPPHRKAALVGARLYGLERSRLQCLQKSAKTGRLYHLGENARGAADRSARRASLQRRTHQILRHPARVYA